MSVWWRPFKAPRRRDGQVHRFDPGTATGGQKEDLSWLSTWFSSTGSLPEPETRNPIPGVTGNPLGNPVLDLAGQPFGQWRSWSPRSHLRLRYSCWLARFLGSRFSGRCPEGGTC